MNKQEVFSSINHQVYNNWYWLKKGEDNSQKWLSKQFNQLHQKISLSSYYKKNLRTNTNIISNSKGYNWTPVYEDKNCRAGFLYLFPERGIPMHDHKQSIGISLVLNGNPAIFQSHSPTTNKSFFQYIQADKVTKKELKPGDISFIFPERNNIHGFNANHSACLLFNIIFFADNHLRNYYLPYSNIQENTKKKRNHTFLNKQFLPLIFY